ncbi:FCS-Like Zinc finger 10-like [Actinidia eriantha]|uniref:FCS-Like Zinc finger 10-like n=1 Tax=Actinidia eriantha TaxID=165200 RepID=UPI0025845A6B|nr:FCS-Like Zinc finger 10-like [Actinidia eriantha]
MDCPKVGLGILNPNESSLLKCSQKDNNAHTNISPDDQQLDFVEDCSNLETSLCPQQPTSLSYKTQVFITANEILVSEDYTRVTWNGPNPKITHTFFDFRLECLPNQLIIIFGNTREEVRVFHQVATCSRGSNSCPSCAFLNLCEACNKKLKEGEEVYIYRGKLSFCSYECLAVGILAEEITKATNNFFVDDHMSASISVIDEIWDSPQSHKTMYGADVCLVRNSNGPGEPVTGVPVTDCNSNGPKVAKFLVW